MTGLSRFLDPTIALVVAATVAAGLRRHPVGLLPLAFGAGLLMAVTAQLREAGRCAVRLPAGEVTLAVRLVDPVSGDEARARAEDSTCHGLLSLRFTSAAALPAGTQLALGGKWVPRVSRYRPATGTLVVRWHDVTGQRPGPGDRLRTALTRSAEGLYGARAPIIDALILGRRTTMDPELNEDFARSGLVHLLSISGFHVGLLISWTVLLGLACRLTRPQAYGLGGVVAVLYVAFLGWPAPATRAAVLGVLIALTVIRQRSVRASATLATAALVVMLIEPWAVFNLGAWLSFSAVAGLAAATRWTDHALGRGWGWRMLAASVGSTLTTAPLTAAVLGAVAPIGILLNFAAIPLAALAVPGVLASLVAALVAPPLASPLAGGAGLTLHGLEVLARVGAAVPGGHLITEPGWAAGAPWVAVAVVAGWGVSGRANAFEAGRRWLVAVAGASWTLLAGTAWSRLAADDAGGLTLHFLDVGQGDGTLIQTPAGRWVLVDAGPADGRFDAGRRVVAPYLARQGARRVEVALVSHAHADHLGGLASVLRRVPAGMIVEPAMPVADEGYDRFLDLVAADGQPWRAGRRGDRFVLDGVSFEILHPDTTWAWWGLDLNENSLVVRVTYADFSALLTGDAGVPAEAELAGRLGAVDLLKVGHHGSRGSTGEAFLAETRPAVAIISAGRNNRHGHPAPEALARLGMAGALIRRTDQDGTIRVTITPGRMRVRTTDRDTTLTLPP